MAGIKKDNHYVPQVYLKQWVSNGKILTYRLLVPHEKCEHWKAHSPKSIAKHQHLYTYFSGSKDSDEIENWLDRDFERSASVSIAKVVKEAQLSVEDWNNLFRFAVAQSIRTPTGMQSFMRRQSQTLKVLLSESLEGSVAKVEASLASGVKLDPAPPLDPFSKLPLKLHRVNNEDGSEGIEALVLNGRKFWIWHLEHILKNTIHRMPTHRWTILHAPTGVTWPTTDNPFTRLGEGANGELSLEGGWGVEGTKLFLPLSPKHLLFACVGQRPPPRGTTVSLSNAAFFRTMIINGASRYIFATDTQDIVEFRPRIVSRELFDAEAKLWADWHANQSEEEAQYPNI
ncbi:DUF4238 domain-containing protein [Pseudomonas viridiflava]|uniref:DUF4238 domain-containing protein n=1 Tax=Pseudomonas viridiflava TaxID=33069 RepID=UPI002EC69D92|nr:DUF4238 domain-containing protein [Pseudomonas viridiflava]